MFWAACLGCPFWYYLITLDSMTDLFVFLLLVSVACLFVGLIKPSLFQKVLKQKATRKGAASIFGISTVLFFVLVGVTGEPPKKVENINQQEPKVTSAVEQQQVEAVKTLEENVPAPVVNTPVEKVITPEERLWTAFNEADMGKRDGDAYAIAYASKNGEAVLTKSPKSYWNEVSILKEAYTDFVRFGLQAFKIDGVKMITLNVKFDVQDKYGKPLVADAVILTMTREQFGKFDWESMKYQNLYSDKYVNDFTKEYVHILIARAVLQKGGEVPLTF